MTPQFPPRLLEGPSNEDEQSASALLARLPAMPADERAASRMWRGLVSGPKPRRSWATALVGALVGAGAVAAALVVALTMKHAPDVRLLASVGGVYVGDDSGWTMRGGGAAVGLSQQVRTDREAKALLGLGVVASVLLAPSTEGSVNQLQHGTVLRLSKGMLTARVSPRPRGEPFVVLSDVYSVRVVGTLFTVARSAEGATLVSVREGVVEVLRAESVVARLTAGQQWSSAAVAPGRDTTSDRVKGLLEEGLRGHITSSLAAGLAAIDVAVDLPKAADAFVPQVQAPATPASEPALLPMATARVAPRPTTTAPMPSVASIAPAPVAPPVAMVVPLTLPATPAPVVAPLVAPAPVAVAETAPAKPVAIVQDSYELAQALFARHDFAGAAREFERTTQTNSEKEETALYQLGRVRLDELHDPAGAEAAFKRYRLRFSHGTFLPDAEFELVRAEFQLKQAGDALIDATRFLADHPGNEHVEDVHFMRGETRRARHEYADAIADYASVTRSGNAGDALWLLAACQQQLGDRAVEVETLKSYLAKYPQGSHRDEARKVLGEDP